MASSLASRPASSLAFLSASSLASRSASSLAFLSASSSATAVLCRKCQIFQPTVMESPVLPIMEGAMISASLATCLACWAGSIGGKAEGSAVEVDPVLWVCEGYTFSARERTKIVSLPAEMV